MHPVPEPHVLDPDRLLDNARDNFRSDHEGRADLLEKGFREASAYAEQLWNALAVARGYLWESLPSDPRSPGEHPHTSASPTGPDDEAGWNRWIEVYSGVTSVLCGPHGDSGFGSGEAREAARFRRDAPNVKVTAGYAGAATSGAASGATSGASEREPEPAAENTSAAHAAKAARGTASTSTVRSAALVLAGLVAGRLLAPRRRTRAQG